MEDRHQLYQDFLKAFPIEHLSEMTLEEYTNLDRSNSFCYWIETRLEQLGSIWGGSSYKFGIFKFQNVPAANTKFLHDDKYAWYARYNAQTAEEAFLTVRDAVVRIANSARDGNYEAIDEITELGDGYKWKIAFLYSNESLMPIYKKEWLIDSCTRLGMENAKKAKIAELQRYLMERKGDKTLFEYYEELGDYLWKNTAQRVWIYSPGENARKWDFCVKHSVMCLGWDELGDYIQYGSRDDIVKKMQVLYNKPNSSCKNDSLAVWEFSRVMKEGDVVIAKDGQKKIVGRGIVESEYFCDESLEDFAHCRKVVWTHVGEWDAPHASVQKTLTDITKYPEYVSDLNQLFEGTTGTASASSNGKYERYIKLLKANRNIVLTGAPGTGKTYLANEIARAMGCDKPGFVQFHPSYDYTDFVEGLRPMSDKNFERMDGVFKAFCKKALKNLTDSQKTKVEIQEELTVQEKIETFLDDAINSAKELQLVTGNTFQVVSFDGDRIGVSNQSNEKVKELGLSYNDLFALLKDAVKLTAVKDVKMYFQRKHNTQQDSYLFVLCNEIQKIKQKTVVTAETVQRKNFVFIIDEINRGELSKIFGELFFSIDPGYRQTPKPISTQYQNLVGEDDVFKGGFFVPENVYIIGTMNDIDRSVESMDFAMRRRFTWIEVKAEESAENMGLSLEKKTRMRRLNDVIKAMEELGEAYQLGAAYFLGDDMTDGERWEYRIKPLLKEYLRGNADCDSHLKQLEVAYAMESASDEDNGQQ